MTTDSPLLFTPEHAAAKLELGRTTVYHLIATGELESVKIGRLRRVTAGALQDYVNRLVRDPVQREPRSARAGSRRRPAPI